jgi:hypothetical protein
MTGPVGEDLTTGLLTARNLAAAPSGVTDVQLTPKKVFAMIVSIGLPVAIAAGWALGQRDPAGAQAGGEGAMGTAPHGEVPTPAAQYDVYEQAPVVIPMASSAAASPTPSPVATTAVAPAPDPTSAATVVPEDQTPSPEPTPSEPDPTPQPSARTSR